MWLIHSHTHRKETPFVLVHAVCELEKFNGARHDLDALAQQPRIELLQRMRPRVERNLDNLTVDQQGLRLRVKFSVASRAGVQTKGRSAEARSTPNSSRSSRVMQLRRYDSITIGFGSR